MNADRLLALYAHIADAPDAVARLRRFVLDLAVRGKLVPQDPGDEPASQLLKRIAKEKARLVKAGEASPLKIRKVASSEDLAFSIPPTWHPATVQEILIELQTGPFGSSLHQSDYKLGGTPVINPASIKNEEIIPIDKMAVDKETVNRLFSFTFRSGDIVMARRGEMGRCAIINDNQAGWLCGTGCLILRASGLVERRFLSLLIGSPFGRQYLSGTAVGSTMQNLNQGILLDLVFGLPPLAEQRRIVAKVDELMGLCDRLEEARTRREAHRARLTTASLSRLTAPDTDAQTFQTHARFALDALPALTTRPDQIKALRQTILSLAVRGKLVEQNPRDEPGSVLLRRVLQERASKSAQGKARGKRATKIADDEGVAELPPSWVVETLGNLVDPTATISYGVLVPGPDVEDGVPFVRVQDLSLRGHAVRPNKTISHKIEAPYARTRLRGGEILLCVVGSVGKLGIAPPSWAGANIARAVARIVPVEAISSAYLLVAMQSEQLQGYFSEATRTLAQPTLNVGLIEKLPVPLPPLAEQHRIVAKVHQLMALCDRLETSLAIADTTRRRLLEALLHEALEPADNTLAAAQ